MKKIQKSKREISIRNKENLSADSKNTTAGITLIALVITIIVLLILTGVAIATLTGENGILNQANRAKIQSDIAEVKEQAQLDIANWMAEKLKNGEDTTLDDATVKSIIETANSDATNKYYSKLTKTSIITKQGNEILFSEFYKKEGTEGVDYSQLSVGDYISNYPVQYDNVEMDGNFIIQDKYNGWRILSIEGKEDNAYVKLVSAGVPLNYYHYYDGDLSVRNLTYGFFNTSIEPSNPQNKFFECGFKTESGTAITDIKSLKGLFTNEFTATLNSVQAMTKDDFDKVLGFESYFTTDFNTNDLLAIPCEVNESSGSDGTVEYFPTFLATTHGWSRESLWIVDLDGWLDQEWNMSGGVRPVVTLKSNVKFTPAESNINDTQTWNISM